MLRSNQLMAFHFIYEPDFLYIKAVFKATQLHVYLMDTAWYLHVRFTCTYNSHKWSFFHPICMTYWCVTSAVYIHTYSMTDRYCLIDIPPLVHHCCTVPPRWWRGLAWTLPWAPRLSCRALGRSSSCRTWTLRTPACMSAAPATSSPRPAMTSRTGLLSVLNVSDPQLKRLVGICLIRLKDLESIRLCSSFC